MRISDHLIELVLSGGGTDEEKRLVMEFLKDNPEKLTQYLTDDSWEQFEEDKLGEVPRLKMLQTIANTVGSAPVGKVRRMRLGWVAAASVVLIAGLVTLLYWKGDRVEKRLSPTISIAHVSEKQTLINSSLKPQTYSLPDGSKVKLAGNSSITYNNPFTDNRRDLYLKGQAVFTVAKDETKPFAVHSKGIMTTALGTVFSVDDRGLYTTVHLFSGRVVVKKEVGDSGTFAAVYLLPGDQLQFNTINLSVKIRRDEPKPAAAAMAVPKQRLHLLQFTKQPLAEIFDLLQKQNAVTIVYDAGGLKNMDFTGTFDSDKETLESFLSTLCDLNELTLKKAGGNRFLIQTK